MFVAIDTNANLRNPMVYGLGATPELALEEAARFVEDDASLDTFEATPALAAAVMRGAVECAIDTRTHTADVL